MSMYRRAVTAGLLFIAAASYAAAPASAQTSVAYNAAATSPPAIAASSPVGAALGSAGQRDATLAAAGSGQVLSLQVSRPAPVATGGQALGRGIAFTGADVITLLLLAVPMIVVGLTLTRGARPRHASQG